MGLNMGASLERSLRAGMRGISLFAKACFQLSLSFVLPIVPAKRIASISSTLPLEFSSGKDNANSLGGRMIREVEQYYSKECWKESLPRADSRRLVE
jgi:hypothetical protein